MLNEKIRGLVSWVLVILICLLGYTYSKSLKPAYESNNEVLIRGVVLSVEDSGAPIPRFPSGKGDSSGQNDGSNPGQFIKGEQHVKVKITEGKFKDQVFETTHVKTGNLAYDFDVFKGDKVILNLDVVDEKVEAVHVAHFDRQSTVNYVFYFFVAALVVVGGWRGFKSLVSLILTGVAVVKILIPAILAGKSPVVSAVIVAAGVTAVTFLLVSGVNRKSLAAIIGTVMGTVVASLMAGLTITQARLTELATEEGGMLLGMPQAGVIDFQGLLLAGIIVGALGAMMDVAISVSSSVYEFKTLNPELGVWQLMRSGLNVGRDIIGTMANTLILANAGGSLSLILIIMGYQIPFIKIVNLDLFTNEIVRSLAGSIGLFFAIPFTALVSSFLFASKK